MSETDSIAQQGTGSTVVDKMYAKAPEHPEEEKKFYTTMFFQKPLTFKQASTWVFCHYLMVGLIQGYNVSVQYNLQSNGASFADQSTLSLALYPYSVKFLFSPLLDRFFISKMGRSKTYIIIGGTVLGSVFCFLGPTIQTLVDETKVVPLTVTFFIVNFMVTIVQIAGEAWILSMFNKEDKSKASTFLSLGQSLGGILGYNVFTPLNDVTWINNNLYPNNHRSTPLVTHSMFCITVALYIFAQIVVNLLFIAEERIMDRKTKDICKILSIVPRHVTNPHMLAFVGYMFATRFIYYMVDSAYDLELVRNGYLDIGRSTLSNVDTITFPFVFMMSYLTIYFMKRGQLIRMFHLTMFVVILNGTFRYITWLNLVVDRNMTLAIIARVFSGIIAGMDFTTFFLMSFFNTIVNKAVGNTGITCLIAIMNQTGTLSNTLGLKLISVLGFTPVVITCLIVQLILLIALFRYTKYFDNKDPKYFDLSEPYKPKSKMMKGTVVDTIASGSIQREKL
jgi:MFS transporter, PAT family, solute carrier family 33 (acetyl-CoA transportor), member 1